MNYQRLHGVMRLQLQYTWCAGASNETACQHHMLEACCGTHWLDGSSFTLDLGAGGRVRGCSRQEAD